MLKPGATVFGRDKDGVDVVIDSATPKIISRNHATIKQAEGSGEYILTSLGINGVLVNQVAVGKVGVVQLFHLICQAVLAFGDIIVFGGAGANTKPGTKMTAKSKSELQYRFEVVPPRPGQPSRS
jgi:hypothetical protein